MRAKTSRSIKHHDPHEIEGINNRVQLADLERLLCRRTIAKLMLDYGVTFIDPKNAYVSARPSSAAIRLFIRTSTSKAKA